MSLEGKGFFKIKLLIVTAIILIVVLISAVFSGIRALSSKKGAAITEISSLGDTAPASNVLGNSYVVSDGKNIFLKNQYDNEEIYMCSDSGSLNRVSNNAPIDMYYYKDYIYYSDSIYDRNISGSRAIYRSKTDGSEEEMLMHFDTDIPYFMLDALADGKLYFTCRREFADDANIYQMDLNTLDVQLLYTVPGNKVMGLVSVNVTSDGLYFKDREGLKKFNPESKVTELVIKDFAADYYTIYKGYIYYTQSKAGKYDKNIVKRVFLDGSDDELLYTGEDSWIHSIVPFVLNDKLFILSKSDPHLHKAYGNIYSCELDGSKLELISEKADLLGLTDDAIYYGFSGNLKIRKEKVGIKQFKTIRSLPVYKRDVNADGNISDEYIFLDPKSVNKGWAVRKISGRFYNEEVQSYYTVEYIYYDENGKPYENGWKNIDGKDYYFGEDGRMYSKEFTPDGYFVGADGTISDFVAPYKFIYSKNPDARIGFRTNMYERLIEKSNNKDNRTSNIIDRGEVYEITNTSVVTRSVLPAKEAELLEAGQNFYFKQEELFCTVTGKEGYNEEFGGECIGLRQSKLFDYEFKLVKEEGGDEYILKAKDADSKVVPNVYQIYSGSIYITKDAKLNTGNAEITFSEYVDYFTEKYGNSHGFQLACIILAYDGAKGTYAITEMSMFD